MPVHTQVLIVGARFLFSLMNSRHVNMHCDGIVFLLCCILMLCIHCMDSFFTANTVSERYGIWTIVGTGIPYTVVSVRYMLSTWSRTCMKRLYFSFIHEKKAFLLKWMAFSWTVNTCHGCTHWWGSKGAQQQYIVIVCRLFFVRLRFLCMLETFQNRVTWFDVH